VVDGFSPVVGKVTRSLIHQNDEKNQTLINPRYAGVYRKLEFHESLSDLLVFFYVFEQLRGAFGGFFVQLLASLPLFVEEFSIKYATKTREYCHYEASEVVPVWQIRHCFIT